MSDHAKLYRNACLVALALTMICYAANMGLLFRSGADSVIVDRVVDFSFMVLFLGGTATGWLADWFGTSDRGYFFFLLPLGACAANTMIALMIAFSVLRMRNREST